MILNLNDAEIGFFEKQNFFKRIINCLFQIKKFNEAFGAEKCLQLASNYVDRKVLWTNKNKLLLYYVLQMPLRIPDQIE